MSTIGGGHYETLYEQEDEEKREICAQATTPAMSVARRYAMKANHTFKWLTDPRFAPDAEGATYGALFLPVEIEGSAVHEAFSHEETSMPLSAPLSARRVDNSLSDGRRILIEGPTALTSVVSLVQSLSV